MKKGTVKLLSLVIVIAMVTALFPMGLTVSAVTGTVTNITVSPSRTPSNTGNNQIKVARVGNTTDGAYLLSADGNPLYGDRIALSNGMRSVHMGAKVKGLTQIYTPVYESSRATGTAGDAIKAFLRSDKEYFNFTADAQGAVIVVFDKDMSTNSAASGNYNNYAGWIRVANGNATLPAGTTSWLTLDPNYEPPTNPYYITRWQYANGAVDGAAPAYNNGLGYAYKKYFAANTPVSIPVPGRSDSQENLIVLIDWNDTETPNAKLSTFTYTVPGGSAAVVSGFNAADEGGTYNVILPKNTTSVTINAKTVNNVVVQSSQSPENGVVDVSSGSGSYTVEVNSDTLHNTYTINFTVSQYSYNSKLSRLTYTPDNGIPGTVTGFTTSDEGGTYRVTLPEGARSVTLEGVVADTGANLVYDKPFLNQLPGTITATVTSDGGTQSKYIVNYDLPGYLIYDTMDRHGAVDSLVRNTMGDWSDAAGATDEYVSIGQDPKDSSNLVAKFNNGSTTAMKYPSIKKHVVFKDNPVAISGQMLMTAATGASSYIEVRKYNQGASFATGLLRFAPDGYIYILGSAIDYRTKYKWVANEWVHYTLVLTPNATDMTKCSMRVIASGGITDEAGNPTVMEDVKTETVNLGITEYLTYDPSNRITVVYNSSLSLNTTTQLYQDNMKIYNPAAGSINIPNNTNISVNGGVEVLLNKYEFNPATAIPEKISVSADNGVTTADVWEVGYDPLKPDKFTLYFNKSLADNTSYTVVLNGVTDVVGNPITGTATFTTKAADPVTGISIGSSGNLNQAYGSTSKVTFTVDTTPGDNVNTNNFVWYLDGVQIGTGKYYSYTPETVGSYNISISVTGNPSLTATPKTVTVAKGIQSAPAAIEVAKTYNTITITPVEGAEYGVKLKSSADEVVYGTNNVFAGLQSETEYTAYVRMAATALYNPSAAVTADVTTEVAPVLVPSVTVNDVANTIVGLDLLTMEYAVSTNGGTTYGDYTSDAPAAFGGNVKVKVRYKETETTPAGEDVILTFTPNYGDVSGDGIIDISDVIMAAEIAVGVSSYTTEQIKRANVSDKVIMTVDISDVVMIAERAVGGTTTFPIDL